MYVPQPYFFVFLGFAIMEYICLIIQLTTLLKHKDFLTLHKRYLQYKYHRLYYVLKVNGR
jgi:hypothetical protein